MCSEEAPGAISAEHAGRATQMIGYHPFCEIVYGTGQKRCWTSDDPTQSEYFETYASICAVLFTLPNQLLLVRNLKCIVISLLHISLRVPLFEGLMLSIGFM